MTNNKFYQLIFNYYLVVIFIKINKCLENTTKTDQHKFLYILTQEYQIQIHKYLIFKFKDLNNLEDRDKEHQELSKVFIKLSRS